MSFLKETRGLVNWSVRDLAKSLNISATAARDLLPILEMQGYIKPEGSDWTTTAAGYEVSGSKTPRLKRESVEAALKRLADSIRVVNKDSDAEYQVVQAVAFGDFMNKALERVQPADVGIRLEPRRTVDDRGSATEYKREIRFLKQLRARSSMLNVRPYDEWMGRRSNVRLL
jgi:hypothetical protein